MKIWRANGHAFFIHPIIILNNYCQILCEKMLMLKVKIDFTLQDYKASVERVYSSSW